ncbi:MAG: SAM-dependent DNA methyltransferase [Bacteroidetes bacterium]|nr:SAM-dependent DNA methyltransferase [Bacteroidota bacterium]
MVKKKQEISKPKADIDFEKDLWGVANELRGAVAENQYKDYVLSLIFLKHMSERYEVRRDELLNLVSEPKSNYYTKNKKEIDAIVNDPDEYLSKNTYIVPKEATWQYLQDNAEQDDIKVKVDDAFELLETTISQFRPELKGILPRIFVKSQLTAKQTTGLINLFSNQKFSEKYNPESDVLGRIYEYYIGRFAIAEGSGAGQFFTPGCIVRLLVEMLEPLKGKIADLACGSGGMFVQSMKFINAHGGSKKDIAIYGQERYDGTLRLAKMNLALRDLNFQLELGDSLLQDKLADLKADYIIMNPPFNVSQWHPEDLPENDPRLFKIKDSNDPVVTDGNANYMWFQTVWSHLSNNGNAGIVMANGAMTSNNKGERNVREFMVNEGMIDCIVRLPDKLFLTTGIPACLFFLSKTRKGNKQHRERNNEILFIDASKLGEMVNRKLRVLTDNEIERIAVTYHEWRNIKGNYEDVKAYSKSAAIDDVIKQDYKLTPGIYVGSEDTEIDLIPFEEKMDRLKATLKQQFAKSNDLQKRIEKNLSTLI